VHFPEIFVHASMIILFRVWLFGSHIMEAALLVQEILLLKFSLIMKDGAKRRDSPIALRYVGNILT